MNPRGLTFDYFHGIMIIADSYSSVTRNYSNGKYFNTYNFKYSLRKISLKYGNVTTLAGKNGREIYDKKTKRCLFILKC